MSEIGKRWVEGNKYISSTQFLTVRAQNNNVRDAILVPRRFDTTFWEPEFYTL